ncbi:MAG: hypothetical protein VKJ04_07695 [Vampirovibrionales bacterium]|nr:hypothetical protein [Vampirovibrionales bacterium]
MAPSEWLKRFWLYFLYRVDSQGLEPNRKTLCLPFFSSLSPANLQRIEAGFPNSLTFFVFNV